MILTCPKCSARFTVPSEAIGPAGRTVRCGACGHSWLHGADADVAPTVPLAIPSDRPSEKAAAADSATLALISAAREQRSGGRGRRAGVWIFLLLLVAAIVFAAYRYRSDVVTLWPPASRFYEALGLKADAPAGAGLRIAPESIRFQHEAQGGTPSLMVSGQIVNGSERAARLVPIRIVLLGKERNVLRTEPLKLEERTLKPGETFEFRARIANPPGDVQAVQIRFAAADN